MAVILGNPAMINAYQAGIPGNGKPFPDGPRWPKSIGRRNRTSSSRMLHWPTNTAVSAARSYWDYNATAEKGFFDVKGATVPVAVSAFPDEIYTAPRSWAEKAYPKLIHYNKLPKGGRFAAWEQPTFYSEELRAGFTPLRDKA